MGFKYSCIKTLKGHTGHIFCLNQLLDRKLINGASDWSLIAWDIDKEIDKEEQVFTLKNVLILLIFSLMEKLHNIVSNS